MPHVFDHTGFITPSLEKSVAFWTEVMGFEPRPIVERSGEWVPPFTGIDGATLRIAHLFSHDAHLEFIEFATARGEPTAAQANQVAVGHVCFKVDDLDATVNKIIAGGGSLAGKITTITEGAAAGIRGLYMRDPLGVLIELLEKAPAKG
ncbi:MAG: VOC family protein [Chelatococcus sp.]|nr:VOC family protein [Chelatococcus sp.]MBX3538269.1 VOC family protein [Chelatococcus sp.]